MSLPLSDAVAAMAALVAYNDSLERPELMSTRMADAAVELEGVLRELRLTIVDEPDPELAEVMAELRRLETGDDVVPPNATGVVSTVMTDTPTPMRPFDPQEAVFTSLAFWVAARDGIDPEEAARRLGALFASEPVAAAAHADEAAAADAAAKSTAATEAVAAITSILDDLRDKLGL